MSDNFETIKHILLFLLLLFVIKWLWDRLDLYVLSMKLSGPSALPFFGSIIFGVKFITSNNTMNVLWEHYKKYLSTFRVWILTDLFLVIIDPDDVERALCNSGVAKPTILSNVWSEMMGNGLFILPNINQTITWKTHRKIITPTLTLSAIKNHYKLMSESCDNLVADIDKLCGKGLVDIETVLSRNCSNIVTETLFNAKFEFNNGKMDEVIEALVTVGTTLFDRIANPMFWIKPIYRLTNVYKKQIKATNILKKFAMDIFKRNNNHTASGATTINALITAKQDERITEEEIIDEIISVWAGASDTTGNALAFLVLMLAMNKECQEKAFQEVNYFFKQNKTLEWDDLDKLTYVDMCMKESLRLFPPAPGFFRYSTKEFKLKNNVTVPTGVNLGIFGYLTMRDPKYWKDPLKFNPERFTSEEILNRHPFSYFPYGGGSRKCIGLIYGRLLIKLYIAHIIKNFEVQSDWKIEDIPMRYDFDCRSLWGIHVKITRRT